MMRPAERNWDWTAAALLFVLFQVAAARLVTTDWAPSLYYAEGLASLATILGLALGVSRFEGKPIFWLAAAYTLLVVPWRLSSGFRGDVLLDRLAAESQAVLLSLRQFSHGQAVGDPFLFVFSVSLIFWLIALVSAYWLARYQRVVPALVLSGAAIVAVQAYADYQPHGTWWIAVFVFVAIVLGGRMHYLKSQQEWKERRVFVNEDSWPNILGSLLLTSTALVLIAWTLPTSRLGLESAADTWRSVRDPIRARLSTAFASLRGPNSRPPDNFFGTSMALGKNAALGDEVLLRVQILQAPEAASRYYWRGRVYDDYRAGAWITPAAQNFPLQPGESIVLPEPADRMQAQFAVTSGFPNQTLLYGPNPVVSVDRAASVVALPIREGVYDTLSWQAKFSMPAGSTYEARAELVAPTVEELRAAGAAYPDWVVQRDLQIPTDLRGPMQALADTAAAGKDNPYDKAAAITNYLRTSLAYSTSVPAAPDGQDPTLWVLTTYKRAFCNYYASAEVLMLRSIGIPARLAVGFAHGDLEGSTYIVHRRDAHAWPEVFFPGYGWLEFEPTANQDPLVRPSGAPAAVGGPPSPLLSRPLDGEDSNQVTPPTGPQQSPAIPFGETPLGRSLLVVILAVEVALLLAIVYRLVPRRRFPGHLEAAFSRAGSAAPGWVRAWKRWDSAQPVERAFAAVNWSLRLLGSPASIASTPAERADVLAGLLPSAAAHIRTLETELERGVYGRGESDVGAARRAAVLLLGQSIWRGVRSAGHRRARP